MDKRKRKTEKDPLASDMSWVFEKKKEWKKFSDLFQFVPKNKSITLRISDELLKEYKKLAEKKHTKYQKLITQALIDFLKEAS
jgi:predicted DNA binding CopG/RHH family protein